MQGQFPFRVGDDIRASVRASVTTKNILQGRVRYIDGTQDKFEVDIAHSSGDRSNELKFSADPFRKDGWIEHISYSTDIVKRGESYVRLSIRGKRTSYSIAAGYIDVRHLPLGMFEPAIGGRGLRYWNPVAVDVTPIDVTMVLAATNAFRIIHGFVWYYHTASEVADRTMQAFLRDIGPALPTGMTSGSKTTSWVSGTITLSQDEEGLIHSHAESGRDGRTVKADDAIRSIDSTSSAPSPWLLGVAETDDATLSFDVSSAHADDRHSIYVDIEEWISP